MQTVKVEIPPALTSSYPIYIGSNILENTGKYVKDCVGAKKLLVVSNTTVYPLYGEKIEKALRQEGFEVESLLLEDGEQYKNIDSLEKILTKAIELRLERKDAMIALGGGVVGDITGFAAATYLRGIDFVQIPTTLLAQVDSSVGGKVAINHKLGKNLIGNFYQPKAVITDITTLNTLSEADLKVGLAEVLKYGFIEKSCGLSGMTTSFTEYLKIHKKQIFELEPAVMEELVKYCCELKATVVNKDEKEAGLRAILNFGHTIGHAIEKCYNYTSINHGEAVAIGMRGAFFIALEKGLIDEAYFKDSLDVLADYGMVYKVSDGAHCTPYKLYESMQVDKKVKAGKIRFVLPVGMAEVGVFDNIDESQVITAIKTLY